jgi:hypothetical protein
MMRTDPVRFETQALIVSALAASAPATSVVPKSPRPALAANAALPVRDSPLRAILRRFDM